ncbi:hypothetical protein LOD99_8303 [Oopsacas minuta]|uniref:NadR/Ttd14 AAA domain-containing protein n=1 Tax=Oopsacas minuta TaxID=111878 RepID=A0AAV7JHR3_9METZ|nr:hypothetical protein LOD99_8303 [Oopsacas minuta]
MSFEGEFLTNFGQDILKKPYGIVVNKEYIFITDILHNSLFKFCKNKLYLLKRTDNSDSKEEELKLPRGLCIDTNGDVFVANRDKHRVSIFSTLLQFKSNLGTKQLYYPHDVKLTQDCVVVLDWSPRCVHLFSRNGDYLSSCISQGDKPNCLLSYPQFFCFDLSGNIIISDTNNHCIKIFTQSGEFIHSIGCKGKKKEELSYPYGPKPREFTEIERYSFQFNLLKTILQLEKTFEDLAQFSKQNCIIICDRGTMDASVYCDEGMWDKMMKEFNTDCVAMRDARYNLIIHLVTAADGASHFYLKAKENNPVRTESADEAIQLDNLLKKAWVGHPYVEVIDNSTDFDGKIRRVKEAICARIGIDVGDRLHIESKKRKFLIQSQIPDEEFPTFQDFDVRHDYLDSPDKNSQIRIRKRGQNGKYAYTCTVRRFVKGEIAEMRRQITSKEYDILVRQRSVDNAPIFKVRRCFMWANQYYQLDVYKEPCTAAGKGIIILETYTTEKGKLDLPKFLTVLSEVTGESRYSMYTLSKLNSQASTPDS